MKKLLLTLTAIFGLAIIAQAKTETFDFTNPLPFGFTPSTEFASGVDIPTGTKLTQGLIDIEVNNKTASIAKFWTGSEASGGNIDFRIYNGASFTISSSETITAIILDGSKITALTPSAGSMQSGMWSGAEKSVVFSVTGTLNISSIEVTTLAAGEVFAPSFYPGGNIYYSPIDVTISCKTAGAKIYYTLNGDEPTTSSQLYSDAIHIPSTTVLRAIASLNGVNSNITEAYYGIEAPDAEVNSIAEFLATNTTGKPNGNAIKINNEVTVSHAGTSKTNNYLYLKDATGALAIYIKGAELNYSYKNGDIIPAGIVGNITFNGGEPQMNPSIPSFLAPTSNNPVTPKVVKMSEITSDLNNQLVVIENVSIDMQNSRLTNGVESFNYYLRFDGVTPTTTTTPVNVAGIVNTYNGNIQLYPTNFNYTSAVETIAPNVTSSISTGNGAINIISPINCELQIINAAGQNIKTTFINSGETSISIAPGFYIVRIAQNSIKVFVK